MGRLHTILRPSYLTVRGRGVSGSETEEGLEGSHGGLSAIVTKDELIEVDLKLRAAHPMVGTNQPLLQIAHSAVGQWNDRCRALP